MPIGYLDVPAGTDLDTKKELVKALYDALHEAYPVPDDTRIFLRAWPLDNASQNGTLGREPARPVFMIHVPEGGDLDVKRRMLRRISEAVTGAYHLPGFMTFIHEHPFDLVALNGELLMDDPERADDQREAYRQRPEGHE